MKFLTPRDVASMLKLNVLTVYEYIQKGHLSAIRLGRQYRISTQDLANFIDLQRTSNIIPKSKRRDIK